MLKYLNYLVSSDYLFKRHSLWGSLEEWLLFNGNVNIINATLKFLIKVQLTKSEIRSLQKSDIWNQFQKLFKSALRYCFKIKLLKFLHPIFFFLSMFSVSFQLHLIRHSGTGRAFKDTQRALKHLRQSKGIWALLSTVWALGHSDTKAIEHFDTGTRALGHLGT